MVKEGSGRLFKRKDDKFLVYLPKDMCEDSAFPFKKWHGTKRNTEARSIALHVTFESNPPRLILTEK